MPDGFLGFFLTGLIVILVLIVLEVIASLILEHNTWYNLTVDEMLIWIIRILDWVIWINITFFILIIVMRYILLLA